MKKKKKKKKGQYPKKMQPDSDWCEKSKTGKYNRQKTVCYFF
jgi:hypothetical protein